MTHVIRNFERHSRADIEAIGKFSPATIHEAQGKLGALDPAIKPIKPGLQFYGPATTTKCHIGDNLMIFEAINLAQPGDVLVVDGGDNPNQGGFGDVLAAACMGKGIAGIVLNVAVRDGRGLRASGFPVFSTGLCIKGTSKDTLGTVNNPIVIGGELVTPGDIIVGDDDGVVVVRTDDVSKLAQACQSREDSEDKLIEMHRQGRMEIEDRYEMMRSKGCVWSD